MATKYLAEGATTFASPAWSGGAIEDTNDLVIERNFGSVQAGLNQSALTDGINSLWIKDNVTSGTIGGPGGSFIADADISSASFVSNFGAVSLYYASGGDDTLCQNFNCGGASRNWLTGGIFTNIGVAGGSIAVNESSVVTNIYGSAGGGTLEYNATKPTLAVFTAATGWSSGR
jgi:hypothetical protein